MSEPLKDLINGQVVREMATRFRLASPGFDAKRFTALASDGLEGLELKPRAMQLCTALEATLPKDFTDAAPIVLRAMEGERGLRGWALWSVGELVARRGLNTPELGLEVLHALTQRFTAEWAIRPFITTHPKVVYATLERWSRDANEHVRRLVSEGSRPLLPWGTRLQAAVADPAPALPLLLALQDDPSEYVRRSVANHLNDIARHHPDIVVQWLETHLSTASPERRSLLRHASRNLIKQGHPRALKAWGIGAPFKGIVSFSLRPRHITLGQHAALSVTLTSSAKKPQTLAIDYVVHHVKADGSTSPKVFKGWSMVLAAGAAVTLTKKHSVKPITTRVYYPGAHRVSLQINGKQVADSTFMLAMG